MATEGQLKAALPAPPAPHPAAKGYPAAGADPARLWGKGRALPRKCRCRNDRGALLAAPELEILTLISLQKHPCGEALSKRVEQGTGL